MSSGIVIVDLGTGNLFSVAKSLARIGANSLISSRAEDIANAKKIILPGVGHFGKAMHALTELNLADALNEAALVKRKPVLGICLGMELMARTSEEGDVAGLGWIDAEVVRFDIADKQRFKVPHIGWNRIEIKKESVLMKGLSGSSEFYFLHSYHLKVNDEADALNKTEYETVFTSAIEKDNLFGVQYHPEKSHDAGARVLRNFVEM